MPDKTFVQQCEFSNIEKTPPKPINFQDLAEDTFQQL